MCIFNGKVIRVSNTQILVTYSTDGKRQLTVYSNKVNTADGNAMILPVPHAASVQFHDLSGYPTLFEDCDDCFSSVVRRSLQAAGWGMTDSYNSRNLLRVHDVGSYRASIVPSFDDFDRLDASVFTLSPAIGDVLRQTYGSEFGYIVCMLRGGNHTYHPFAYSHNVLGSTLFVPTLHEHGHVTGDVGFQAAASEPDWDHTIYSFGTDQRWHDRRSWTQKLESALSMDKLPTGFDYRIDRMNRMSITGNYPNKDLYMSFTLPKSPLLGVAERAINRLVEAVGHYVPF
jgi:hypothetical protein